MVNQVLVPGGNLCLIARIWMGRHFLVHNLVVCSYIAIDMRDGRMVIAIALT